MTHQSKIIVAAAVAGAVILAVGVTARARTHRAHGQRRRLAGPRDQITDRATLDRRLKALRRDFKKVYLDDGQAIRDAFLKLRRRVDDISRAASGFVDGAADLTDQAIRDLVAAKENALEVYRARLDTATRGAADEVREARRRARPWFLESSSKAARHTDSDAPKRRRKRETGVTVPCPVITDAEAAENIRRGVRS